MGSAKQANFQDTRWTVVSPTRREVPATRPRLKSTHQSARATTGVHATSGQPDTRVEESVHDEFKNLSVALPHHIQ